MVTPHWLNNKKSVSKECLAYLDTHRPGGTVGGSGSVGQFDPEGL